MNTIAIGSDHGGLQLKKVLIEFLERNGYKYQDFGETNCKENC